MKHKTAKISGLIRLLQEMQEECGDLPIALASDSEFNSVGTINADGNVGADLIEENGLVVLFPYAEGLDPEDIIGYNAPDDEEDEDDDGIYDADHAAEWMERNPHGYYNSEDDYGIDDDEE